MNHLQVNLTNQIVLTNTPPRLAAEVKKKLSLENPQYVEAITFGRSTRGIPPKLHLYEELGNCLVLPRGFLNDLQHTAKAQQLNLQLSDQTTSFPARQLPRISLWPHQAKLVDEVLRHRQGIVVGACGSGKTVMGLALYARLGQPCLWLTHTRGLARQAAKRLEYFTGEKAGFIAGKQWEPRHFTVALVQTLARRDISELVKNYGLIIVDEVQHVPAKSFSQVVGQFWAARRYGLTATPQREDGLGPLMFHICGPILGELNRQELRRLGYLMTPEVRRQPTGFTFPYNSRSHKYDYKALEDALLQNSARNELVTRDVVLEAFQEENICIVLVNRIEHGEILYAMISQIYDNVGLIHSKLPEKKVDSLLDSFSAGNLRILIATYRMLAEGFDYPPSNRLFLTAPHKARSLIEQASGRIERIAPGKRDAVVYDYVDDNIEVLRKQADARFAVYRDNAVSVVNLD